MSIHSKRPPNGRAVRPATRSAMSLYAKRSHRKAAKLLGYALTLDTPEGWLAASVVWQAILTPQEAATMAYAAFTALPPDLAEIVTTEALGSAEMPLPTFSDVVDEARWWADRATPDERAAYAVACFNRFSAFERDQFRAFVEGR